MFSKVEKVTYLEYESEVSNFKNDKEMLEDMIIACINQAQEEVDRISKEKMGALSGGMPGLPGF